jgi:isochorismate synthase
MPNAWVYFRLPGQAPQGFTSSFETKQDIHAITEPYFLVAPFGEHAVPIALIPQTVIHQIPEENLYTHKAYSGISTSQEKYISMIEEAQRTFASGMLEKVVLSRVFFIPLARLSLNIYFEALCKAYPSCLVSAVSMEGFGTWMGASPEILFELKEEKLRTYSLAGTRVVGELAWGEKEQQEQKWVTEYIEHKLGIDGFKMLPTQTNLRMGSIEHLLTEFEKKDSQENLYQLLLKLLPVVFL